MSKEKDKCVAQGGQPQRSGAKTASYHCASEIGLCSGKEGGHGRLGRVETGLLSRTLPIGTKGADRSTKTVPLAL